MLRLKHVVYRSLKIIRVILISCILLLDVAGVLCQIDGLRWRRHVVLNLLVLLI